MRALLHMHKCPPSNTHMHTHMYFTGTTCTEGSACWAAYDSALNTGCERVSRLKTVDAPGGFSGFKVTKVFGAVVGSLCRHPHNQAGCI